MPIYIGKHHSKSNRYVGENVPQDVARRRRDVRDIMRRMGTPMLHKPRYTDRDVQKGIAVRSAEFDDVYGQGRNRDPLSHGVGYVSVDLSENEWYDANGTIIVSNSNPGSGYTKAPKYRGFGPRTLTYIIEPDRAEDFYKSTVGGPIFKVQSAQAIAPWWPDIDDNDLLIQVALDEHGEVVDSHERFEAKNVDPVSMRGLDQRGRKEPGAPGSIPPFGNSHLMNQRFEMNLIPFNDVLYEVEIDR